MKLLITGGAGFIGSNFVHYWLKNHPDDEVINFDKLTYAGNLKNLEDIKNNPKHTFIKGDICDKEQVDAAMHGVDIIIHFAAETHVDRSIADATPFVVTNVLGTQVLLDAALKHNIKRFHHISTDEVFGALSLDPTEKFTEETPYNPHSPYSASKAGSDHLVRAYGDTYNLPFTITNCSNNFGPHHFPEKFIPLAITNIIEGKKVPIYGDGLYVRDWLYVEDHCSAIEAVLERGKIGQTYCVGGMTDTIANKDIIKLICELMNVEFDNTVEYVKDRPGHDRRYAIDWIKINSELGWSPKWSFAEALESTIEWFQANQTWWKEIKNGAYLDYYKKQYNQ